MITVAGRNTQNRESFEYPLIVDNLIRPLPMPYLTDRPQTHATEQPACRMGVVAVYIRSIIVLVVY